MNPYVRRKAKKYSIACLKISRVRYLRRDEFRLDTRLPPDCGCRDPLILEDSLVIWELKNRTLLDLRVLLVLLFDKSSLVVFVFVFKFKSDESSVVSVKGKDCCWTGPSDCGCRKKDNGQQRLLACCCNLRSRLNRKEYDSITISCLRTEYHSVPMTALIAINKISTGIARKIHRISSAISPLSHSIDPSSLSQPRG